MGKTYKDLKDFDTKRAKEASRNTFKDVDMRTRVKSIQNKERGGGKNWRHKFDENQEGE